MNLKQAIKDKARSLGFDDCRVTSAAAPEGGGWLREWLGRGYHGSMGYIERNASKRKDPGLVLAGAKSIIAVAASYSGTRTADASKAGQGTIARYARYQDYHNVLAAPLQGLTDFVTTHGPQGTRALWYIDTGPVLERELAQRAGLGFIGKHTNLISRSAGNWFFIAEILTTLELEPDVPERNRCGSCTRCITACPTGAIRAPFVLDARLCISYLTIELKGSIPVELRPAVGTRIYGCDDCLAVCPWNRFARDAALMGSAARPDLSNPALLELLQLDDEGFRQRFSGTPILRTRRRGLLRNVCVALGNSAGPEALPVLEKASQDAEPLIAEHACWAIEQIRARTERAA